MTLSAISGKEKESQNSSASDGAEARDLVPIQDVLHGCVHFQFTAALLLWEPVKQISSRVPSESTSLLTSDLCYWCLLPMLIILKHNLYNILHVRNLPEGICHLMCDGRFCDSHWEGILSTDHCFDCDAEN